MPRLCGADTANPSLCHLLASEEAEGWKSWAGGPRELCVTLGLHYTCLCLAKPDTFQLAGSTKSVEAQWAQACEAILPSLLFLTESCP